MWKHTAAYRSNKTTWQLKVRLRLKKKLISKNRKKKVSYNALYNFKLKLLATRKDQFCKRTMMVKQ